MNREEKQYFGGCLALFLFWCLVGLMIYVGFGEVIMHLFDGARDGLDEILHRGG